MAIFWTPARERILAITATVLLHALVLLVLLRFDGGRPGSPSARDGGAGKGGALEVVEFVALPGEATSPAPPAVPALQAQATEASTQQPLADAVPLPTTSQPTPPGEASANDEKGGGTGAPEDDLGTRYLAAVRAVIDTQWQQQGGGVIPTGCEVVIHQADGGRVLRAWVMHCGALPLADRIRLETAVMQAQSLPYTGFEPVFQATLRLRY